MGTTKEHKNSEIGKKERNGGTDKERKDGEIVIKH